MNSNAPLTMKWSQTTHYTIAPAYQSAGAACVDIHSTEPARYAVPAGGTLEVDTGIKLAIPEGWCGLVFSRSGHGFNHGVRLANCVGVIDSDYRGNIKIKLHNDSKVPYTIQEFERVAQIMFVQCPQFTFEQVTDVEVEFETERGAGGFGSTGK